MDELDELTGSVVSVDIATEPEAAVIKISGELDLSSVGRLETDVDRVLASTPRRLVVDVSGVRFADSSAIALWVRWAGAVPEFELRDPPALVRRVIGAMGLDQKLGVAQ